MTDRKLMQQALDAFSGLLTFNPTAEEYQMGREAVAVLRDRLAQPEDWQYVQKLNSFSYPRPWVGLTDEERTNLWREFTGWGDPSFDDENLMKAIEAQLKEKNT